MISIYQSVNLLELKSDWHLDDLVYSFREKAKRYHPDTQKGLENLGKSHEIMILLNNARNVLESFWKKNGSFQGLFEVTSQVSFPRVDPDNLDEIMEKLKDRFRFHRERAKKGLYVFYRFNLQRIALRNSGTGLRWYREYRRYLDKAIADLKVLMRDVYELKEGDNSGQIDELYKIFMKGLIFFDAFVRASECSNVLPDYNCTIQEKQVFQAYRKGSDVIDQALIELFMKKIEGERIVLTNVQELLLNASGLYSHLIKVYPDVSWLREINVKGQLVLSALSYLYEFYT